MWIFEPPEWWGQKSAFQTLPAVQYVAYHSISGQGMGLRSCLPTLLQALLEQAHPFTCQQVHFSKSKMRAIFCFLEVSPNLKSILTLLNEKVCVVGRLDSNAMLYDRWGISVWTRWDIIESWLNQVTHHGRTCGWKTTLLLGSKSNEHRFEIKPALDS